MYANRTLKKGGCNSAPRAPVGLFCIFLAMKCTVFQSNINKVT